MNKFVSSSFSPFVLKSVFLPHSEQLDQNDNWKTNLLLIIRIPHLARNGWMKKEQYRIEGLSLEHLFFLKKRILQAFVEAHFFNSNFLDFLPTCISDDQMSH